MSCPRLFLDASVWIAAAGSSIGASALVLSVCLEGHAHAVTSRIVLREAERDIRAKLGSDALVGFYQRLASVPLELPKDPTPKEIAVQSQIIDAKDAHVLAAALGAGVDVLLTLDRKHFFCRKVREAGLLFSITTPGDFLRTLVHGAATDRER